MSERFIHAIEELAVVSVLFLILSIALHRAKNLRLTPELRREWKNNLLYLLADVLVVLPVLSWMFSSGARGLAAIGWVGWAADWFQTAPDWLSSAFDCMQS